LCAGGRGGASASAAFPALGPPEVFLCVAAFLPLRDLACACLPVSPAWHALLDHAEAAEHLWAAGCERAWQGKAYVPASLRGIAKGAAAVEAAADEERAALLSTKVSSFMIPSIKV